MSRISRRSFSPVPPRWSRRPPSMPGRRRPMSTLLLSAPAPPASPPPAAPAPARRALRCSRRAAHRRPLHHRHQPVRRAVRSRRALAACPGSNPLVALAPATGLEVYSAPRGQSVRVGPRNARDAELENFLTALVRSRRAIDEAGRKADMAAARALPADLGNWRATIEFILGPYTCGGLSATSRPTISPMPASATSPISAGRAAARCSPSLPLALRRGSTRR